MNVFDFAMKMELDGKAYYQKMAEKTKLPGLKNIWLVSRICGDNQVPAARQVYDIRRFVSIPAS